MRGPFLFRGKSLNRLITQIGQSIYEWFFTKPAQDNMVALGKLAAAVLGTSPLANGLPCTPTSPASLQVSIGAGEVYALAALEATAYGTLPADTTHQIVKQGVSLDPVLVSCAPPPTSGQAINYLIQVQYQDLDVSLDPTTGNAAPVVLQFYNSSNPSQPWQGPNNSGQTSSTFRKGVVAIQAKAGIAASTGSQVTPAPDTGWIGLWVVTVANGQASITAGNIAQYAGAPILPASILQAIQTNLLVSGTDTGVANACVVNIVPAVQALADNMVVWFKAKATNTGATTLNYGGLGAQPVVGAAHSALQGGEIVANGKCVAIWNATINSWVLLECTGGAQQLGAGSYGVTPATGNRSTSLATTAMFANEFGVLLSGNGYQKLPSGLIVQWFSYGGVGTAGATFNYPIAFPNGRLGIALAHQQIKGGATVIVSASVGTNSQVDITASASGTSGYAIAVGY